MQSCKGFQQLKKPEFKKTRCGIRNDLLNKQSLAEVCDATKDAVIYRCLVQKNLNLDNCTIRVNKENV